jgi:RHS repeat-associated protein
MCSNSWRIPGTERDWNTAAIVRRYVHGAGGEPLAWYEGSGTSTRRYFHGDERGSIVAVSDSSGALYAINTYDEHGIPGASNSGRFQYTGQAWMPEIGMYYYRARVYSPTLGRFLQTDPIGFGGGMSRDAYVSGDPVNATDPAGTCGPGTRAPTPEELAACQASQSAFYADYHPMNYLGGNEMAAYMQGQMFNAAVGGGGAIGCPDITSPVSRRDHTRDMTRKDGYRSQPQRFGLEEHLCIWVGCRQVSVFQSVMLHIHLHAGRPLANQFL